MKIKLPSGSTHTVDKPVFDYIRSLDLWINTPRGTPPEPVEIVRKVKKKYIQLEIFN